MFTCSINGRRIRYRRYPDLPGRGCDGPLVASLASRSTTMQEAATMRTMESHTQPLITTYERTIPLTCSSPKSCDSSCEAPTVSLICAFTVAVIMHIQAHTT